MGRLETKTIATASLTTEVDQPDHPTQIPSPTTISSVTSSDQQENDAPDSISTVQVNPPCIEVPPCGNQEQPPFRHLEDQDNKLENIEAVAFPPRPFMTVAPPPQDPNNPVAAPPQDPNNPPNNPVAAPPQDPNNQIMADVPPQNHQPQNQNGGAIPPVILVPFVGVPWHSGLFDCCQQPTNAIITTFAPYVTFGQIAEIVDNGSTSCLTGAFLYIFLFLVLCHWNMGVSYRRRMRNAFQIAETPVTDRIAHVMFPLCALCQEFRELQYRGLDPFLGYQGVIAGILHGQNPQNVPPANQLMTRD